MYRWKNKDSSRARTQTPVYLSPQPSLLADSATWVLTQNLLCSRDQMHSYPSPSNSTADLWGETRVLAVSSRGLSSGHV